jgi:predicted helicase
MNAYGLEKINTFDQLLLWLQSNLNWPIDEMEVEEEPFGDLTFEYDPAKDLGLKAKDVAHFREICQLRPFVSNQPWGIFFISFEDKKIPIGVLKRVLGGLTLKKRQSANKSHQKGWNLHDLLFISAHGESGGRELSFLHFAEENENNNKIVLKELGWDKNDTNLKLTYVANTLKDHLAWPEDQNDTDSWRESWAGAFTSKHGAALSTAKELTERLGALATKIRQSVNEVIVVESADGPLTQIYENFKQTLFHSLDHDGFADMYAQTICYGLLAASIMRRSSGLVIDDAALIAPLTHPFLKDLMEAFLAVGGSEKNINFNELGTDDVVDALDNCDMEAVLRDFGNKNPNEDPILHFYEHFLKDYDSIMREQRGVYYTPLPVVKFIVRGVDEILQKEFGLEYGLADTTTWREMIKRDSALSIPEGVNHNEPFVQILDPATGTGTFLVEVIDLIEKRMKGKWKKEGKTDPESDTLWNDYVPANLLPRLNGFELMMAPYAIAHIKIGMKLAETGYLPKETTQRVRVYLTNTLEEPINIGQQTTMHIITESLATEARGADEIKARTPITVVIGNPPYSGHSINNGIPWIVERIQDYRREFPDLQKPGQGKWLQDDYVKFIRYSQYRIAETGSGVLGFITNHAYLDNPTFKGMRKSLSENFQKLWLYDLHGNTKKRETSPDGSIDDNVFEIQQGVAILFGKRQLGKEASFLRAELYGKKYDKNMFLLSAAKSSCGFKVLDIRPPQWIFAIKDKDIENEYREFTVVTEIFSENGDPAIGIVTTHDEFAISWSREEAINKVNILCSTETEEQARQHFKLCTQKQWNYQKAKNILSLKNSNWQRDVIPIQYRLFDSRVTVYNSNVAVHRRERVMKHLLPGQNLGLSTVRQLAGKDWGHAFCANLVTDDCYISNKSKERGYIFPLYLMYYDIESAIRPNLSPSFINTLGTQLGMTYDSGMEATQTNMGLPEDSPELTTLNMPDHNIGHGDLVKNFGPRDVFNYIYAVLHSPTYRGRYAEFLKSDFPRIPLPGSTVLFRDLVALGRQLVALHLLDEEEVPSIVNPETRFICRGETRVEKGYPIYDNGKVMINSSCYFEDVTPDTWNFYIGSYQVCAKWLKDRAGKGGKNPNAGRILSEADILHYRRITIAIRDTLALMGQVDEVITTHGGWPDAFYRPSPPPPSIEEIIKVDESSEIEFKSTLQWDVKENKKNTDLRKACLKTIVAFLNSKGGALLIGVTDDKEIYGLEQDLKITKESLDWFEQTFRNLCDDSIGVDFSQYINVRFQNMPDEKKVCIVEIDPAPEPAFLSFKMKESQPKQEFFIRRGNATKSLESKEQHDYIKKRFSS